VEEATILGLGIYEDTGSLTHLTTTPDDLIAAAWLLEKEPSSISSPSSSPTT